MTTLVLQLTVKQASQLEQAAKAVGLPREELAKAAIRMLLRSCASDVTPRKRRRKG